MRGGISIIISKPNELEINQLFEVIQECKQDLINQGIHQWGHVYPDKDVIRGDISNQSIFTLRVDGEIAGIISLDKDDCKEYQTINWNYKGDQFAVVHRLCVRPKYQGRGIGLKLMQFIHEACKQELIKSVRLDVYSGNDNAIEFYKKLGYQIRGEVFFPRRNLPFLCMEKEIL